MLKMNRLIMLIAVSVSFSAAARASESDDGAGGTPQREPAAIAPAPFTAPHTEIAPSPSPFKFSGFANVGFVSQTPNFDPSEANAHSVSGFNLEEAALYGNYEKDKASFLMDLSVRRQIDSDFNQTAQSPNQSSRNGMTFGSDHSQLYMKYRLTPELTVDFGQFDTIFGLEYSDSKDRVFNRFAAVSLTMLPATHMGLMVEWNRGPFSLKGIAANPNNGGSNGNSTKTGNSTEYALAGGYVKDWFHAQVGGLGRSVQRANGNSMGTRMLYDAVVGVSLGAFNWDIEYARIDDPGKNSLTANADDHETSAGGILTVISYKLDPIWTVGMRYEDIRHDPLSLGYKSVNETGLSVHYKLSPEIELRSEYVDARYKKLTQESLGGGRLDISALINF